VYEILFYEDTDGNRPIENFIDELDALASTNKDARIQLEQIIYCCQVKNSQRKSREIFGNYVPGIIEYCFLDGMVINLYWYIIFGNLHKRCQPEKLPLLREEWRTG
jgi:hypothetical protein